MKTISTLLLLLTVVIANAQWTAETDVNTLVADAEALDIQAKGTSDGMTYIVFWEDVGAPENIQLRLQILDVDGNQTLGTNGMLVSDQIPMGTFTVLWNMEVDADDNLYIGVTGTGGGDPVFVFKMDSDGNHLWASDGVNVGSGQVATIAPMSNGGAVVSWLASSGAVMQKYDSSGTAIWPSAQPIENGSDVTAPAALFELSNDEVMAVFHVLTGGINSNLYAQRYDADGNAVWTENAQLSDKATAFNRKYSYTQDGDTVFVGYFAATGLRFDSFLQRVNADGSLPWGVNGSDFDVNETDYETDSAIAFEEGSDVVWSICNYTDDTQSMLGVFVQKFNKDTGDRLLTENGKEVYALGSDKARMGALQLKEDSPLFIIEDGVGNGATPSELHAVYLDENGDFAWDDEAMPVATFSASKSRIQYTMPVNNQSVAVFVEDKGDGPRVFAQNVIDEELSIDTIAIAADINFANPVDDQLQIWSNVAITKVEIYSSLGQRLKVLEGSEQKNLVYDVSELSSGIYFLKIETNNAISKGLKMIKY
ncbi:T9SS type A sorting domain-containing protein [Flavobacteriaceae bacterium TK19130]|nr:T9SS type A sorting domain-containing protein [Thermobacterium salinum]